MKKKPFVIFIFLLFFSIRSFAVDCSSISNVETLKAAKPLGAYSQATVANLNQGKLIFVSGQVAIDPKTGKLLEGDIQTATRQTIANIEAILKAAGSSLQCVVRMDVFLKDFNDWDGMNDVYKKYFPNGKYPARQTVQVGMENRIEISAIAIVPNNANSG